MHFRVEEKALMRKRQAAISGRERAICKPNVKCGFLWSSQVCDKFFSCYRGIPLTFASAEDEVYLNKSAGAERESLTYASDDVRRGRQTLNRAPPSKRALRARVKTPQRSGDAGNGRQFA